MSDEHQSAIDDREWYTFTGFPRYRRLFFDRILPWLIFAGIIFGIYYLTIYSVNTLISLSGPLTNDTIGVDP